MSARWGIGLVGFAQSLNCLTVLVVGTLGWERRTGWGRHDKHLWCCPCRVRLFWPVYLVTVAQFNEHVFMAICLYISFSLANFASTRSVTLVHGCIAVKPHLKVMFTWTLAFLFISFKQSYWRRLNVWECGRPEPIVSQQLYNQPVKLSSTLTCMASATFCSDAVCECNLSVCLDAPSDDKEMCRCTIICLDAPSDGEEIAGKVHFFCHIRLCTLHW